MNDELADMMDTHNDIQEAMGRSYAMPDEIDEEELLGELDSLETELALEGEAAPKGAVPSYLVDQPLPELPSAPVGGGGGSGVPVPVPVPEGAYPAYPSVAMPQPVAAGGAEFTPPPAAYAPPKR